jgi:hypothetical protein
MFDCTLKITTKTIMICSVYFREFHMSINPTKLKSQFNVINSQTSKTRQGVNISYNVRPQIPNLTIQH